MKTAILLALVGAFTMPAFASGACDAQFSKAIEKTAKAHGVSISSMHDLGTTTKNEEHYSVLAYYSDSACEGDSQTFQIYTEKDGCRVVAIHANGDEDCGD